MSCNLKGPQRIVCLTELNGHVYEVKSTFILQPGPAALTEGVRQLHTILACVSGGALRPDLAPLEAIDPDLQNRLPACRQ